MINTITTCWNFPKLRPMVVLDVAHKMLIVHAGDQALDPLLVKLLAGVAGCYSVKDGSKSLALSRGKSLNPTQIMPRFS